MMGATRRQLGVAAIEFALLCALVLVPMALGAIEFGRAFYQYNTLVKATRTAAREFSFGSPLGTVGNRADLARCLAVYGKRPCDGSKDAPILEGLTTGLVAISDTKKGNLSESGLPGVDYDYYYFCVTIDGFPFRSLASWVLPDISFGKIEACMRQAQ